ncbi:hypothetical protein ROZALSC1DRAFT_25132 [Rozella allomycis CSF55]|uniref:Uncharacterized protein n=1 Tax=Rozella allomycis (strain CSF55) TaxID=988480 RepID=A0A4P9YBU1_ROZAC|nr:hypothetical protein ROZALSC1DRAFT_25132 [Rozella allomycis CSF55]
MLKKILPLVVILRSVLCSTIPQRQSFGEVPRFLESLLNQVSDEDLRVSFEDEQDVDLQDDQEIDYAQVYSISHDSGQEYATSNVQSHQPAHPSYQAFAASTIPLHHSGYDAHANLNAIQANPSHGNSGQTGRTQTSRDEDFTPRIIANVQYIVSVLDRVKVGRRLEEKREYEKARKMINDLFLELGSHRKVRAALLKVKRYLDSRLESQYRNVLASPEFFSEEEKDKINDLFLRVGYNGIIAVLKNDSSWTRPIYNRTLDIVLSSPKYYSVAERQKVVGLFRGGSKDAILQTRKEVRKLLEEDSSWTRPVRDDALKQIEEELAMELMR